MTNKEIEFRLSLTDGLTAKWNSITDKMKAGAKDLVRTFQANWAAISAGAFAAFEVVRQGFDMMQEWAKGEVMRGSFNATMKQMGLDAEEQFSKIRTAAAGLIDDDGLAAMANKWLGMGMKIEQLSDVMVIARVKAREMGISAAESFEKLATAIAAGQERGLKALNIAVDTAAANEAYAATLGKTAAQLTDVEKKQATLNAVLDAGKRSLEGVDLSLTTVNEKIQRIQATIEEAKDFAGEAVARIGLSVLSVLSALTAAGIHFARVFIWPIARLEEGLAALGMTTSTRMRDAEAQLVSYRDRAMDMMKETYDAAMASSDEISGAALAGAIATENMTSAANAAIIAANAAAQFAAQQGNGARQAWVAIDGIREKTKKFAIEYEQTITDTVRQSATLVRLTAKDMQTTFGEVYNAIWEINGGFQSSLLAGLDSIHYGIVDYIGGAWESMFGEANSLLEMFIKSFVEQLTSNVVKSAIGGLLSLFTGGGFLGGIFGGLFHGGGTVMKAHSGAYIDAPPSREIPILVRGGETIRTEAQEREIQRAAGARGGITINVHVNGPVADSQSFKQILEKGMRETGITDAVQYFRNTRSNLVLQA